MEDRAAEGSDSHRGQMNRWCSGLNIRRGSESTGSSVNMKELRDVQWGEVMEGLKGEEVDAVFDREPVKLLKDRSDVLYGGSSANKSGS